MPPGRPCGATKLVDMPTRRVIHRPDRGIDDAQQLLVRFGQDTDVAQALRLALISSRLYSSLPGYEDRGASLRVGLPGRG